MADADADLRADVAAGRPVKVRPLARALNRSYAAVYEAIGRKEIASARIGRAIRIPAQEAARLLGLATEKAA